MTKERVAKAQATKAAKREQFAKEDIQIDDDWKIIRADELNYEVQYQGKFWGYFPSLVGAFQALPAKMLRQTTNRSIADVVANQKAINETVEKALAFKIA